MFNPGRVVALFSVAAMVACDPVAGPEISPNFNVNGNPVVQSATGSGHFRLADGNLRTFTASAVKREDGTVTGQSQINNRSADVKAHSAIDCLLIVGNTAVMSGVITSSSNPDLVGSGIFWAVQDNGEGKNDPADQVTFAFTAPPTPDFCILIGPPPNGFLRPIEKGNIQVRE